MKRRSTKKRVSKKTGRPRGTVVAVLTGGSRLASTPGFMDALRAFQYGDSSEESGAGFSKMVEIGSRVISEEKKRKK